MSSEDRYTDRVRAVLGGQLAPPAPAGQGTRILFRCPACHRIWLRSRPSASLALSRDEIEHLAVELHADPAHLPQATCRICLATTEAPGEIELDGYHDRGGRLLGIGLSYEGVEPPGAHVLLTAHNRAWLQHERTAPRAGVIVDFVRTRAVLQWLAKLPYPTGGYLPITPADSAVMARDNPPGHRAPGTQEWLWKGGSWQGSVPPLDGRCVLTVAQALPPDDPESLSATLAIARLLAEIVLAGRIAGEPEDGTLDHGLRQGDASG